MNILSVANALKEVKLKDLDDEFQIHILTKLNGVLPDELAITSEHTGLQIRSLIDAQITADLRTIIMGLEFIGSNPTLVRFYNNVEKAQQFNETKVDYDDAIKGNFFSTFSFFVMVLVALLLGIYVVTPQTRGTVPESRIVSVIDYAVHGLATAVNPKVIGEEVSEKDH